MGRSAVPPTTPPITPPGTPPTMPPGTPLAKPYSRVLARAGGGGCWGWACMSEGAVASVSTGRGRICLGPDAADPAGVAGVATPPTRARSSDGVTTNATAAPRTRATASTTANVRPGSSVFFTTHLLTGLYRLDPTPIPVVPRVRI